MRGRGKNSLNNARSAPARSLKDLKVEVTLWDKEDAPLTYNSPNNDVKSLQNVLLSSFDDYRPVYYWQGEVEFSVEEQKLLRKIAKKERISFWLKNINRFPRTNNTINIIQPKMLARDIHHKKQADPIRDILLVSDKYKNIPGMKELEERLLKQLLSPQALVQDKWTGATGDLNPLEAATLFYFLAPDNLNSLLKTNLIPSYKHSKIAYVYHERMMKPFLEDIKNANGDFEKLTRLIAKRYLCQIETQIDNIGFDGADDSDWEHRVLVLLEFLDQIPNTRAKTPNEKYALKTVKAKINELKKTNLGYFEKALDQDF